MIINISEILNSLIPPSKKVFSLLWLSGRWRELKPVYNIVVEDLVVEVIVLDGPKSAARQGKAKLKVDH